MTSMQERCENAFDNMIAGLRYGCITVNVPCTMGFSVTALPWGAFPGNTPNNISSGGSVSVCGWVCNAARGTGQLLHGQSGMYQSAFCRLPLLTFISSWLCIAGLRQYAVAMCIRVQLAWGGGGQPGLANPRP